MPSSLTKSLVQASAGWQIEEKSHEPLSPEQVRVADLVIICALKDPELDKTLSALSTTAFTQAVADKNDPSRYFHGRLTTTAGSELRVVAAAPNLMGTAASAILATKMILKFRPRLVIMSGIAGGVASAGVGFGDILIADQTVDYGAGKITRVSGKKVLRPSPNPIPVAPNLLSQLRNRGSTADDCHRITQNWPGAVPETRLQVHIGTFGTNDLVLDDSDTVKEVTDRWRKLVAVEMETHAVHRACLETARPQPVFLAVKSASDLASKKTDQWREFAAFTSAEFVACLIRNDWEQMI